MDTLARIVSDCSVGGRKCDLYGVSIQLCSRCGSPLATCILPGLAVCVQVDRDRSAIYLLDHDVRLVGRSLLDRLGSVGLFPAAFAIDGFSKERVSASMFAYRSVPVYSISYLSGGSRRAQSRGLQFMHDA